MNKDRRVFTNIVKVTISNVVILIASLLANFCLPNIMLVSQYGIYKEFALYFSYCGLLHLGFIDGLYIKYGGQRYENIDKNELEVYTTFFYIFQYSMLIIALLVGIIIGKEMRFFIMALAVLAVVNNITTFYQYLSQATERFNELTIRNLLKSILQILTIVALVVIVKKGYFENISAKFYIIVTVVIASTLAVWYEKTYRCFSMIKIGAICRYHKEIRSVFICGLPILIAGSISNLILISDRQFAVILVSNEEYAMYAFAYSVAALLTTLVSAISVVLFPMIKKIDSSNYGISYRKSLAMVLVTAFFFGAFYRIIEWIIPILVPNYAVSLVYLLILMPAMIINMVITAVNTNYYKALGLNGKYLKLSLIIFLIAIITNGFFYYIMQSLKGLSVASVLTFIIWFLLSTLNISKHVRINPLPFILYVFVMIAVFYLCHCLMKGIAGSFVYILCWAVLSVVYYKRSIK